MNARRTPSALSPFWSGGSLALLSALAFGLTTPLVQRFGELAGPFLTAALLYAGAAVESFAPSRSRRSPPSPEWRP